MASGYVALEHRRRLEVFVEIYVKSPYRDPLRVPVPSPIDEDMLREHEDLLGTRLPPLFQAYLVTTCLPGESDLYVGQLPPIFPDRPFRWIERWSIEKMDDPFYRRHPRLIPFTHGVADMSDYCFDVGRPDIRGDYPIVRVDGHWVARRASRSPFEFEDHRIFRSFSDYLDYLENWLIYRSSENELGFSFEDWLRVNGKKGRVYGQGD